MHELYIQNTGIGHLEVVYTLHNEYYLYYILLLHAQKLCNSSNKIFCGIRILITYADKINIPKMDSNTVKPV